MQLHFEGETRARWARWSVCGGGLPELVEWWWWWTQLLLQPYLGCLTLPLSLTCCPHTTISFSCPSSPLTLPTICLHRVKMGENCVGGEGSRLTLGKLVHTTTHTHAHHLITPHAVLVLSWSWSCPKISLADLGDGWRERERWNGERDRECWHYRRKTKYLQ